MTLTVEQGKKYALSELKKRRENNKNIEKIQNHTLSAGSPMYFYCLTCNETIVMPESHPLSPKLCRECEALKECGWLE